MRHKNNGKNEKFYNYVHCHVQRGNEQQRVKRDRKQRDARNYVQDEFENVHYLRGSQGNKRQLKPDLMNNGSSKEALRESTASRFFFFLLFFFLFFFFFFLSLLFVCLLLSFLLFLIHSPVSSEYPNRMQSLQGFRKKKKKKQKQTNYKRKKELLSRFCQDYLISLFTSQTTTCP